MVLAAPELVETERVDLLDEIEVAAELQQGILADRVMRGEKGTELEARHRGFSPDLLFFGMARMPNYGVGQGMAILAARRQRMVVA
jgi:hypothetical protein